MFNVDTLVPGCKEGGDSPQACNCCFVWFYFALTDSILFPFSVWGDGEANRPLTEEEEWRPLF